jgi:hypothetical protein
VPNENKKLDILRPGSRKWKEVVEKAKLSTRKFSAWKKKKILVQPTSKACTPVCDMSNIFKNLYFPSETC